MNRTTFRLLIAVLTFTIGITGVWLLSRKPKVKKALPQVSIESSTTIPESEKPKFATTFRGCGMGYMQGYELPDGREMSEGSGCFESSRLARKEWRKLIGQASQIVGRVPQYKNRFGEKGERIVALFPPDEYGREWAKIMWYDGGDCYLSINAPTLEVALEFEKSNGYAY